MYLPPTSAAPSPTSTYGATAMADIKLDVNQLTVTTFAVSGADRIAPSGESDPGMCTCIDICPTDGTCIAYGCVNDPFTVAVTE